MEKNFIKVAEPCVGAEEAEAVTRVILSGNYVSGKQVESFETAFADYIGCKYAVAVNSGTSALYIALESIGVGKGDEVIVPAMTFFSTVSSVLYLGATPVFADIDPDDFCLSPGSVEENISEKTKAIIPVHLFGNPAKMDKFLQISKDRGIPLVEDCAQAHGAEYNHEKVGGLGRAGCFSFFATKHMTTGEGGMITSNDSKLVEKARILRNHGMQGRDDHVLLGYNNRMTEIEAAMGLVQLQKLDGMNTRRVENSEYLLDHIEKMAWAKVPRPTGNLKLTYFWCPVMVDEAVSTKDTAMLRKHLESNGIGYRHRYNEPLYKQPVLKKTGHDYSDVFLPVAEKVAGNVIGLPNHPGLSRDDLDRVIEVLNRF